MSLVLQLVIVLCPTRWPHGYVSSLNNGHLCLWSCNWSYLDAPLRLENGYVSSLNNRHICLWSCNWSYLDAPLWLENGYVSSFNNRHLCLWSCNWSYLYAPLDGYMAMCLVLTIDIYVPGPAIGHTFMPH